MLDGVKLREAVADAFFAEFECAGSDAGCHAVVQVVFALQCQFLDGHGKWVLMRNVDCEFVGLIRGVDRGRSPGMEAVCGQVVLQLRFGLPGRHGHHAGGKRARSLAAFPAGHRQRIVGVEDEEVRVGLVRSNAPLGIGVLFDVVVVPVEVVRGDVEEHRDVRSEGIDPVQLKTAHLHHLVIDGTRAFAQIACPALADVPHARDVATGVFKQRRDEGRGGGFAVGTGYGDNALSVGACVSAGKFNFADELPAGRLDALHERSGFRDARAFDDRSTGFGCADYPCLVVAVRFPLHTSSVQLGGTVSRYRTRVAHPRLQTLAHREQGSTCAAFACSEDGYNGVGHGFIELSG